MPMEMHENINRRKQWKVGLQHLITPLEDKQSNLKADKLH